MRTPTVVIATRDRRAELCRTLRLLAGLPERPEVVVVDNASTDGTAPMVRELFPGAGLISLPRNAGAAARNAGVRAAAGPYVAFSDDDSWWAAGSLRHAAELLDGHPRLGLLAARTLVGAENAADPVNAMMAKSPLPPEPDLPGIPVLGFLACAAVVRKEAFLGVGGFSDLLGACCEEELLAADLSAAGWGLSYVDQVIAHHHPSPRRDATGRRCLEQRNRLLVRWLRHPPADAAAATWRLARQARGDAVSRRALAGAFALLPRALAGRRRLPPHVERGLRLTAQGGPGAC
jgi:GT2 family glycosyltransferase